MQWGKPVGEHGAGAEKIAFIAASSLPTRTAVSIASADAGSTVEVTARDAVGLGLKTGMKRKYEQWIASIVDGLRAALT